LFFFFLHFFAARKRASPTSLVAIYDSDTQIEFLYAFI
jgi:hypothetical protein